MTRDADDEHGENQRRHQHLDHAQENARQNLKIGRVKPRRLAVGKEISDSNTEDHRNDDPPGLRETAGYYGHALGALRVGVPVLVKLPLPFGQRA